MFIYYCLTSQLSCSKTVVFRLLLLYVPPVREAISYRGLFTAGWFGVREKHCFRLEIFDRLRANEQAECQEGVGLSTLRWYGGDVVMMWRWWYIYPRIKTWLWIEMGWNGCGNGVKT